MVAPLSSPSPSSTSATSSTGRHLPASTSESALAARARLASKQPPPPPPPAQPKRVRPFILRARNSAAPAASASSKGNAANSEEADLTSQLRKSKTTCYLEASAGPSPTRPRQSKSARDHENVPPPPLAHHRSSPTRAKKRIARPISLATNSLRAIGSFSSSSATASASASASGSNTGSSAAAAGTAKPASGMMATTRRRPLSYVVSSSSPPRTRHTPATASHRAPSTSPSRTRTPRTRASAPPPEESPSSSRRAYTTTAAAAAAGRAGRASISSASRMSALPSSAASPRTLASPPHAVKTQSRHAAVELHKSALKRKTLEERQQAREGGATSPSALEPFTGSGGNGHPESPSIPTASSATEASTMGRGGLTRSRRWFGKLEPEETDDTCAHTHLDNTPTAATQRELNAYASIPPTAARDSPAARKKASYAALPVHHPDRSDRATQEQPATNHTGYTSLQELLEQHGYADTRVITPHSTTQTARIRSAMADDVRADLFSYPDDANEDGDDDEEVEVLASPLADRTRNRSSSPGPKRLPKTAEDVPTEPKELKERPSLLSLRGLFSFFGSSAVDVEEDLATSPQLGFQQRTEEKPSPSHTTTLESEATPVPQRLRTVSEMHRWVETVNEVYPPPPMLPIPASTTSSATAVMPELHFEHTADDGDDDAASCRSYSSSISFSGSPPTPQPLFGGVDYGVVAPSSFSGSHLSPPVPVHDADLPRNKRLSLRHTVSDSNLLPSYQSFAGLGISAPSPPPTLRSQLAATRPAQMDLVTGGRETTAVITSSSSSSAAATAHVGAASGLWGTTLLRTRASQLFSLAMARSPVDAATGRSFFTMPPPPLARLEPTTFRSASSRAPPKLLRKAVSSAGLVSAPQVRRTRVVTKASWESFGSLEAKVSLEGGRPGSAASGGEADLDGGIGWGEDLLGRAWA